MTWDSLRRLGEPFVTPRAVARDLTIGRTIAGRRVLENALATKLVAGLMMLAKDRHEDESLRSPSGGGTQR